MIEVNGEALPKPEPCDPREIVSAVERLLVGELRFERQRCLPEDLEHLDGALDDFADWCEWYGLAGTAHELAAYLIELRRREGAPYEELHRIARAFLFNHVWHTRVPVMGALRHCATMPGAIAALH